MARSKDDQPSDAATPSGGRKLRRTFELTDDTPTAFDRPTASLIPSLRGEETAATPQDEIRDAFRRLSQTRLPMAPDEPENTKES